MDNSIHLKYLAISQTDLKWGMTINSVGFQNIAAQIGRASCRERV